MTGSSYLVKGQDPILRDRALDELLDELAGDDDRALAVEEFTVPGRRGDGDAAGGGGGGGADEREAVVAAVLNAASSPPFMTARRIVVVRDAGALTAADAGVVGQYLESPLDTSVMVLVSGGGTLPAALTKSLHAAGVVEHGPRSEQTKEVLADAARAARVKLRPDAKDLVSEHLGGDAGRVETLVEMLRAAYGDDATLTADDVAPYLGEAGSIPSYELTNAIEEGDDPRALGVLQRLLHAPTPRDPDGMHPLQVLGMLASHYRRLLHLDDPAVRSVDDAIEALGGRVTQFPARKALEAARALGTDGIRRAFDALHQADLDLKGARGTPPDAVIQVLVVRLARLSRASGATPRPRRRPRAS